MPEEVVAAGTPETPAAPVTPPTPPPAAAGANADVWEKEKRGLIGETQRERQARQKIEQDFKTLQSQHEQAQKRIQALAGVNPNSDQEAQDAEIRRAFKEKFPEYADLTADDVAALKEMRAQTSRLEASEKAMWKKHTNQVLGSINAKLAERLGGDVKDLSDKKKATIRREYIAFIEENQLAGKDYASLHEDGDEGIQNEFLDAYLKEWEEPIRRTVTSTEIGVRRPLPSGKGRSLATTGVKKIDFNNEKNVQDAAVEVFKNLGGNFGQ